MRFYDSPSIERIGFDFYCDIANNIVKLREENGFTQKDLAVKTGIKEYRISNMENVKIRIDLDAVEELAKALNVCLLPYHRDQHILHKEDLEKEKHRSKGRKKIIRHFHYVFESHLNKLCL